MLCVHLLQCLVCIASEEDCYSTQITTAFSGTTKYHNFHNDEDALRKASRAKYPVKVALSQTDFSRFKITHSDTIIELYSMVCCTL